MAKLMIDLDLILQKREIIKHIIILRGNVIYYKPNKTLKMEKFEIATAKHYYAGKEKTHISVYPVIVTNSLRNGEPWDCPYKLNIKTAFFNGSNWRWQQIFTGMEENIPLKKWDDVLRYTEMELDNISSIITPLFNEDRFAAWEAHKKINNPISTKVIGFEKEDNDYDFVEYLVKGLEKPKTSGIDDLIIVSELDNWEDSPRTTLEHWMPIWIAWKHFYDVFKLDLEQKKLAII